MQLAPAAVIIEAVRDIGVLLNLPKLDASADGVNRPRQAQKHIARLRLNPVQRALDFAGQGHFAQALTIDRLVQAERQAGVRARGSDVPHLRFSPLIVTLRRIRVVRMHLNGHLLARGDEFDEQREVNLGSKPDLDAPWPLHRARVQANRPRVAHCYCCSRMNSSMRSSPRFSSCIDVAYEIRMWRSVPNASPGTTATNFSASSFSENCIAEEMPRPNAVEMLGYA